MRSEGQPRVTILFVFDNATNWIFTVSFAFFVLRLFTCITVINCAFICKAQAEYSRKRKFACFHIILTNPSAQLRLLPSNLPHLPNWHIFSAENAGTTFIWLSVPLGVFTGFIIDKEGLYHSVL